MRWGRVVAFVSLLLLWGSALPSVAEDTGERSYPTQKTRGPDGALRVPDTPNPFTAFLPPGQTADVATWTAYLNAAGKERAGREAPGAPRRPFRVAEQEPADTSGQNDVLADAERIARFGSAPGKKPAAVIAGTAPVVEGDDVAIAIAERDGSLGLATDVLIDVGDTATGSGVVGDETGGDLPVDFDFLRIPGVSAGETIIVDVDTPEPFGDLDPFVAVWNPALSPFEIAANDDDGESFDSFLAFTAPVDGDYFVSIGGFGAFVPEDPTDPGSPSVTGDVGSEGTYDVTLALVAADRDLFAFDLRAGDIVGVAGRGDLASVAFLDPDGSLRIASSQNATFIHPPVSPLPGNGESAASFVVDADGTYLLDLTATGPYEADLRVFRPAKERAGQQTQVLYLDFDGATLDPGIFFGGPLGFDVELSPLADFLPRWGLSPADEDAVIDAIVAAVEESISADPRAFGANGDRDAGGGPGSFDVEVRNSRDHPDPWGQRFVSRVIVGGTIDELLIPTIGIAQSIDVGDFESEETAVVLLDLVSGIPSDDLFIPDVSLNEVPRAPGATMVDLIGIAVGNITSHEAGHFTANWHTDQFNGTSNLMDQGGNFPGIVGLGPDGIFGTGDDIDVDFGVDEYVPNEGFRGMEDTLDSIAFGWATGRGRR